MSVEVSKTGSVANPPAVAHIVIDTDITDILADPVLTNDQKRKAAFMRVVRELADAANIDEKTDAEIDAERDAAIAYATAEAARLKALRPTGTF